MNGATLAAGIAAKWDVSGGARRKNIHRKFRENKGNIGVNHVSCYSNCKYFVVVKIFSFLFHSVRSALENAFVSCIGYLGQLALGCKCVYAMVEACQILYKKKFIIKECF